MTKGLVSRRVALDVLTSIEQTNAYSNLALEAALKKKEAKAMSDRDKAFAHALVHGVTRNRAKLDKHIEKFSKKPLAKMPASLRNVLRLGVFQLLEMTDIPSSAVVNTSTELAKQTGHRGQASFTNAILRNFLRGQEAPGASKKDPEELSDDDLAVEYSLPQWLLDRWRTAYGADQALALAKFSQSEPTLIIRTALEAITPEGLQEVLANKGVRTTISPLVKDCLIVDKKSFRGSPETLPGYKEGLFSFQDDSAALISLIVDPQPGELIVDLCAAPGGKSLHIAEMLANTGRVIAIDSRASRLKLIDENRTRLGLKNVESKVFDGREFALEKLADRVLVDAPCSGTGVINRRSDLRHQKQEADILKLAQLQKELLANAARLVKPGGYLVYSTCSIEPEENIQIAEWFLKNHENFSEDDLSAFLPEQFRSSSSSSSSQSSIQLLPSQHGVSGFFAAKFKRLN